MNNYPFNATKDHVGTKAYPVDNDGRGSVEVTIVTEPFTLTIHNTFKTDKPITQEFVMVEYNGVRCIVANVFSDSPR